jgi:structural maintenance of chromosome 4
VVDSDDEEEVGNRTRAHDPEEDDFEPEAPKSPPKRQTRGSRKSSAPPPTTTTAPRRGRSRKTPAASIEPSEVFDADATIKPDPDSPPVKKASPRKRKSAAPRSSIASVPELAPPTPEPTASPESSEVQATALGDITTSTVNMTQNPDDTQATIKPIKPMDTIMEKPMDIMLKARTMTVPIIEDTTPKPRIVLTHLILNNFKSYAGRQEVGPFHASFSSVVGPNGSGKSNVIDSLLFVFGFRASKMRQGKISALIHNSAEHSNLEFCEVAVHFREVLDQVCCSLTHYELN